nr:hypothetical protein [Tanacetum cinerariifolium]
GFGATGRRPDFRHQRGCGRPQATDCNADAETEQVQLPQAVGKPAEQGAGAIHEYRQHHGLLAADLVGDVPEEEAADSGCQQKPSHGRYD